MINNLFVYEYVYSLHHLFDINNIIFNYKPYIKNISAVVECDNSDEFSYNPYNEEFIDFKSKYLNNKDLLSNFDSITFLCWCDEDTDERDFILKMSKNDSKIKLIDISKERNKSILFWYGFF